jgi:hypothetical protein
MPVCVLFPLGKYFNFEYLLVNNGSFNKCLFNSSFID